jgi:hypothetical protein
VLFLVVVFDVYFVYTHFKIQIAGRIKLQSSSENISRKTVFGCIGTIRLLAGHYLIVLTSYEVVDQIQGYRVYRATGFDTVRCFAPETYGSLSKVQKRDESRYLHILHASLQCGSRRLYFSSGYDLTLNRQRQHLFRSSSRAPCFPKYQGDMMVNDEQTDSEVRFCTAHERSDPNTDGCHVEEPGAAEYPITCWQTADKRFCWNQLPGKTLAAAVKAKGNVGHHDIQSVILPLVCGSFESMQESIMNTTVKVTLIARTSIGRVGIRNHCRGLDSGGEAANFIETEQVLEIPGCRAMYSFVIIRGSVPLRWSQPLVNLAWNQRIQVNEPTDITPVHRHFARLLSRYGIITVVDLLGTSGDEGRLKACFKKALASLPLPRMCGEKGVRYFQYDVRTESQRGFPAQLEELRTWSKSEVCQQGYFANMLDDRAVNAAIRMQKGVFRVNCKDCLDRTNIIQCLLAQIALQQQIRTAKAQYGDSMSPRVVRMHRKLWANHGDRISLQYAGTGALRRDVVRVGKRTLTGLLRDGRVALTRYVRAKFSDGWAQDGLSLWTLNNDELPVRNARYGWSFSFRFACCVLNRFLQEGVMFESPVLS